MDAQAIIAQLQQTLRDAGMPVTTDNLNRAMLAMSRGEAMERSEQRAQPARPRGQAAAPQGGESSNPALASSGEARPANSMEAIVQEQVAATAPPARAEANRPGEFPSGPIQEDPEMARFRAMNEPQPRSSRLPMTRDIPVVDADVGLGYDPRTERLDAYGRPEVVIPGQRVSRPQGPMDIFTDPAYMGITAPVQAVAGAARVLPRIGDMLRVTPRPQGAPVQAPASAPATNASTPQAAQPQMSRLQDGISVGMPQARTGQAISAAENVTPLTGRQAASAMGPAGNATFQAAREAVRRGGPRGQRTGNAAR